jgi:hypothetical protein
LGTRPQSSASSEYSFDLASGGYCDRALALNAWLNCTINVSDDLAKLRAADVPLDYDALADLKVTAAASNGGTATANVDAYSIDVSAATALGGGLAADEFVYRNSQLGKYQVAGSSSPPAT